MVKERYEDLAPAKRRRLLVRALLRPLVTATLLVTLYYVLPMDRRLSGYTIADLVVGLGALVGIITWQFRAITRARYPGVRAIEALAIIVPLYLLLFASAYFVMQRADASNFTQPLTRTDALYFSVTVFATVGFGDITARSETARLVVTTQMIGDLVLLGFGVRVLLDAVQRGQQRRSQETDDAGAQSVQR